MCVCVQESPPLLRESPNTQERQQHCISERRAMSLRYLNSVQDFQSLSEAWGPVGGAKYIYLLCENRDPEKEILPHLLLPLTFYHSIITFRQGIPKEKHQR